MPTITFTAEDREEERRILEAYDPARRLPDYSNLLGRADWDQALEYLRDELRTRTRQCQVVRAVVDLHPADKREVFQALLELGGRTPGDDWFDELQERLPHDVHGESGLGEMWFDIVSLAENEVLELVSG